MNNVVLIGRLTRDPELRYLPSGNNTAVARFNLAVDRQYSKEKKAEMEAKNQPTADFINITVWGRQAENVSNYLVKGLLVAVEGRIQTGSYEAKDGTRRYTTEVVANRVEFLEWANDRSGGSQGSGYYQNDYNNNNNNQNYSQSNDEDDLGDIEGFYSIDNDDIPF